MRKAKLPVIQNCDGCGACCMQQGSPPGYLMVMNWNPAWGDMSGVEDMKADIERFKKLPAEALRILKDYEKAVLKNATAEDMPCVWLDLNTKRCRFHEHRPQICRDFEIGCKGCRSWREMFEVGS